MIGSEKPSTIRAKLRQSFKKNDAELLAWFNRQIADSEHQTKGNQAEIDTLRLLRDALVEEAKSPATRRKPRGVPVTPRNEVSPRPRFGFWEWHMELEGVVHNGVIVPDDAAALPEGTRVRIEPLPVEKPKTFGERYAAFRGAIESPEDLAAQHEHYRLGTPKR